ncbi:hypothetical protein FHL15_006837 [Xylaria flabelliformis]|uniref:Uncharacterized protein n=1 Tax=Xylaria flabelliformis TaxID=2512241 RepID=A0A553HW90_9PEZI|nr:hypothetical protein FHL15_006837 [Xylaria flabelliformis]
MSDAWFAQKVAPDGDTTDGCHPEEAQALKVYLSGNSTPSQAAQAVAKPISHSPDPNGDLPRLWNLLTDALLELPLSTIPSLVELIRAIDALPPPDFSALSEANRPAHGQLWRGLPGFGHFWADGYPSLRQWLNDGGNSKPAAEREAVVSRSIRRAEIEARLAREGLAGIPMDWGYESVADALEQSPTEVGAEIPAACKWVQIAGERFREGAQRGESSWGLEKKRDHWNGEEKSHMSAERWTFWIRRLREIEANEKASKVVGDAVKECLGSIDEAIAEK